MAGNLGQRTGAKRVENTICNRRPAVWADGLCGLYRMGDPLGIDAYA